MKFGELAIPMALTRWRHTRGGVSITYVDIVIPHRFEIWDNVRI